MALRNLPHVECNKKQRHFSPNIRHQSDQYRSTFLLNLRQKTISHLSSPATTKIINNIHGGLFFLFIQKISYDQKRFAYHKFAAQDKFDSSQFVFKKISGFKSILCSLYATLYSFKFLQYLCIVQLRDQILLPKI